MIQGGFFQSASTVSFYGFLFFLPDRPEFDLKDLANVPSSVPSQDFGIRRQQNLDENTLCLEEQRVTPRKIKRITPPVFCNHTPRVPLQTSFGRVYSRFSRGTRGGNGQLRADSSLPSGLSEMKLLASCTELHRAASSSFPICLCLLTLVYFSASRKP